MFGNTQKMEILSEIVTIVVIAVVALFQACAEDKLRKIFMKKVRTKS